MKQRIGFLGGNSQLAAELAVYATIQGDVEAVCFLRSEFSAPFFRLLGISYHLIDYRAVSSEAREALAGCEAVIDCSFPASQVQDTLPQITLVTRQVMDGLKPGTRYIYMSSIMAFGMSPTADTVRHCYIPRTGYAWIKRKAEEIVLESAGKHQLRAYVFRLGQVHGVLQSVSQHFRQSLSAGVVRTTGNPESVTTAVFSHSVFEAILRCLRDELSEQSVFALVAIPQWSLDSLFSFYRSYYGIDCKIVFIGCAHPGQHGVQILKVQLQKMVSSSRGIIEPFMIRTAPQVVPRLKGLFRQQSIAHSSPVTEKTLSHLFGKIPGKYVDGTKSSMEYTIAEQRRIEASLAAALVP